jgi:hypothetical protein
VQFLDSEYPVMLLKSHVDIFQLLFLQVGYHSYLLTKIGNNEIYVTGSIKQSSEFTRIDPPFTSKIVDLQPSFYTHFVVTGMLDILIY